MKSTLSYLILFVVILSSFIGCKKTKCDQSQVAHLTLSQNDRSIDPYTDNVKLVFKNMNGDSILLMNGSRTTGVNTTFEYDPIEADEYHHGCRGDYFITEHDLFNIRSQNDSNKIMITLGYDYSFDNPNSAKLISLYFNTKDSQCWCFQGVFEFRNDSIIGSHIKWDSVVAYHNQIFIGPKSFTNVVELYSLCPDPNCVEWYGTAYYSIKDGFVGLRSNSGNIWYLD